MAIIDRPLRWLATLSLFSFPLVCLGVEGHNKQWYQIELYIYATDSDQASNSETWKSPDALGIRYPLPIIELLDLSQANSGIRSEPDIKILDSNTHDFATEPYLKLPQNQYVSLKIKKKLSRSRQYRMLYEAAWRQPIEGRKKSTPILIRGGNQYDDYFELEGTVSLSVSRYLHIHTDLWLSQFVRKTDPNNELEDENELERANRDFLIDSDFEDINSFNYNNIKSNSATTNPAIASDKLDSHDWQYQSDLLPSSNIITSHYKSIRTVQLKQSRRMRSKELHYLDHPLLGMIVTVIPYKKPVKTVYADDFEELPPWEQEIIKEMGH